MAKQTVPDMKELFRQAAEIAQQVPENMQEAAFNRALDLLVGATATTKPDGTPTTAPQTAAAIQQRETAGSVADLLQRLDSTQHPGVRSATKVLDRSLMVLQIALRDHTVDGLTATEIATILTEKFRLGTSRQAVGMALKDASNLVDRVPEGKGYRYRIMGPGEDYLSHLEDGTREVLAVESVPTPKSRKTRKRRKRKKAATESAGAPAASEPTSPRTARKGRSKRSPPTKLGPKAAITGLIEEGFFVSHKTGPEVQAHLKKKKGFDLGTAQLRLAMLRLVRDGVLERDENDEGQYAYKRA